MTTNEPCPHPSIVAFDQGDKITTQCTKCGKKMNVVKKPKCSCYGGCGCDVCNPVVKDSLTPQADTPRTDTRKLEAEVERLRSQLIRAVEIADKIWSDCSNGSEHTELAALKEEIK